MIESYHLKGKTALVGGGSKGLGYACAFALGKMGANVIITSRNQSNIDIALQKMKTESIIAHGFSSDLSKLTDIKLLFEHITREHGAIDILVNNSGGPISGSFDTFSEKDWQIAFESILLFNIRLTNFAIPFMRKRQWGRIVNICSLTVKEPAENLILSNVFRTGVVSFAKTISKVLIKDNITVNNVLPGAFLTDRARELLKAASSQSGLTEEELINSNTNSFPIQRYLRPAELGSIVAFLCSNSASAITGTSIQVDGGFSHTLF